MANPEGNLVVDKSIQFALNCIQYCEAWEANRKYAIARQLIRSGTSIGANVQESQSAESRADFIHKMKIADKEINETKYWLMLCKASPSYPDPGELFNQVMELKRIVSKIIISTRKSQP